MKYWILAFMEDSCNCGTCGRVIKSGKPAFILVDTSKPTGGAEWVNCLDCIMEKFPDIHSEF
ncbi:hypothetical protein ES703_00686 [subsurface metagenome]